MFRKLIILPAAFLAFACGGNDKKVDDALNADLSVAAQLPAFEENITTLRWTKSSSGWRWPSFRMSMMSCRSTR